MRDGAAGAPTDRRSKGVESERQSGVRYGAFRAGLLLIVISHYPRPKLYIIRYETGRATVLMRGVTGCTEDIIFKHALALSCGYFSLALRSLGGNDSEC